MGVHFDPHSSLGRVKGACSIKRRTFDRAIPKIAKFMLMGAFVTKWANMAISY